MYTFKKEPQFHRRDPDHAVETWCGTLDGGGAAVYNIYTKRAGDIVGRQEPTSPFTERHLVWVKYVLTEHGDVTIKLVKVSFDDGEGWSVYYDQENECVGTRTIGSNMDWARHSCTQHPIN